MPSELHEMTLDELESWYLADDNGSDFPAFMAEIRRRLDHIPHTIGSEVMSEPDELLALCDRIELDPVYDSSGRIVLRISGTDRDRITAAARRSVVPVAVMEAAKWIVGDEHPGGIAVAWDNAVTAARWICSLAPGATK